jgi:preprotein translocase subunit SecY
MIGGLGNVGKVPELRNRILFTLLMLAVYRLGIFVPTPGINAAELAARFSRAAEGLFGMVNLFSGGALEDFSIFTLGIMPYISMSIIIQFLTPVIPSLEALKKEGASGQKILMRYTRQGTMILALLQGFMIAKGLESQSGLVYPGVGGVKFYITTMLTLTAGTAFIMWLGEQITERGIGNGMSIIIFAGIVARMPRAFFEIISRAADPASSDVTWFTVLILLVFCTATIAAIVYVERSQRRIPLQYPRSERMLAKEIGPTPYLPLKVNSAGVIPPIFASAIMVLPVTIGALFIGSESTVIQDIMSYVAPGTATYTVIYVILIFIFAYYYVSVQMSPKDMADNLKKQGAFIPTVRPGTQTADYLYGVLNRLTFWGAIYIALVCVVPNYIYKQLGAESLGYVFGGTAVLIAVGVTLDTASQIQSILTARHYEAFMTKSAKGKMGMGPFRGTKTRILKR